MSNDDAKAATNLGEPLTRNNYFVGRLLKAEDFQTEQTYHIGERRRHNRIVHGAGVLTGLMVSVHDFLACVQPGLAFDCLGREICICEPAEVKLPESRGVTYLGVCYSERLTDPVPMMSEGRESQAPTLVVESFELVLERKDDRRHPRRGRCWQSCGKEHPVWLARLRWRRGSWRVDRWFRRPVVRSGC